MRLEIETNSEADNSIQTAFNYLIRSQQGEAVITNANKSYLLSVLTTNLPSLKCGSIGSHLWIANKQNKRLATIYL